MAGRILLTAISIGVGTLSFVFGLVGLCTNHWLNETSGSGTTGLWKVCSSSQCDDLLIGKDRKYYAYEIVRGFGILAVIMAFGGISIGAMSLIIKKLKVGPSILATFFLMGAFFGLVASSVYSSLQHGSGTSWGYSFILTWLAFPISLIAGALMLVATFKSSS